MPPSNGGTLAPLNVALYPMVQGITSNAFYRFNTTLNFADQNSPSVYSWKIEDVIAGRIPTINRVIITIRDLGICQINVTLSGMGGPDDAIVPVSATVPLAIGTILGSKKLITYSVIGLSLTAQNLQLTITRPAGAGPVSITKVRMEGRVETTPYG